jgi:circadian clock protein KaiC
MSKIKTGLPGLDQILYGGLLPQKSYLLLGGPGSGKSTLGLHFLTEAVKEGEEGLYITLGESKSSIISNASRQGFDLSEITFLDLSPGDELKTSYNVFTSAEVEQGPIMEMIQDMVEKYQPDRVLLDSITMLRTLNNDSFQMRRLVLSFINYVVGQGATLMMISESVENVAEKEVTFWVDGIIKLDNSPNSRKISVDKYRGSDYVAGTHSFKITDSGITVFPQLRPRQYKGNFSSEKISSGIDELNNLLNGGIEKDTTTLIVGETGVGKTNLGIQFLKEAASKKQRSVIYSFEESSELIIHRSENVNIPVADMIETGNLEIVSVEPLSYSPDEFTSMVRREVQENGTELVMIDSVGGYSMAIREENTLERLHALTVFLKNNGVTTLIMNESKNITGDFRTTDMNASYLADNILFLKYIELDGQLKKAIGVLKKRLSGFENTIREFSITSDGIVVGQPLQNMRGILTGLPEKTS